MEQRKLHKTIENIASKKYLTEKDLLSDVLKQVIENSEIKVTGGRIWKLLPDKSEYSLLFQTGDVQKIPKDFVLPVNEYPIFDIITEQRTILSDETNKTLKSKGIFKYSASGVGSKIKIEGKRYYEYLLAVNSNIIDENLGYTLNIVATVLTSKLKERRLTHTQKFLIEDIDKARQIQKSILPEHEYSFSNYDMFGVTIPADIIGGDFFDYLNVGDDRLGIVVGDAASKGLGAAAEAMYISGAIRMASTFEIKISPLMNRLNQLVNKIFADDKFATLFYCEISNDNRGLCLYANAGHNPPIFIDYETKKITYLQPTGPLIGPAPHSKYETDSLNFLPGDVLVIYSDGIVEAANEKYDLYETERLEKIILNSIEKSPKEIVYNILEDVMKFSTKNSKYKDDKTIVVLKRKE